MKNTYVKHSYVLTLDLDTHSKLKNYLYAYQLLKQWLSFLLPDFITGKYVNNNSRSVLFLYMVTCDAMIDKNPHVISSQPHIYKRLLSCHKRFDRSE